MVSPDKVKNTHKTVEHEARREFEEEEQCLTEPEKETGKACRKKSLKHDLASGGSQAAGVAESSWGGAVVIKNELGRTVGEVQCDWQ